MRDQVFQLQSELGRANVRACTVLVSNTSETELVGPATIQKILATVNGEPTIVFAQGQNQATTNVPIALSALTFPFELPAGATLRSHGPTALFVMGICRQ